MAWAISMPFETFSDADRIDPPDPAREGETGAAPVKLAAGLDCGSNHHGGHVRVPRERRTGCRAEVGFIHSFTGEGGGGCLAGTSEALTPGIDTWARWIWLGHVGKNTMERLCAEGG